MAEGFSFHDLLVNVPLKMRDVVPNPVTMAATSLSRYARMKVTARPSTMMAKAIHWLLVSKSRSPCNAFFWLSRKCAESSSNCFKILSGISGTTRLKPSICSGVGNGLLSVWKPHRGLSGSRHAILPEQALFVSYCASAISPTTLFIESRIRKPKFCQRFSASAEGCRGTCFE